MSPITDHEPDMRESLEARVKELEAGLAKFTTAWCSPPPKYPPCGYVHADGCVQPSTHPGCIARDLLRRKG